MTVDLGSARERLRELGIVADDVAEDGAQLDLDEHEAERLAKGETSPTGKVASVQQEDIDRTEADSDAADTAGEPASLTDPGPVESRTDAFSSIQRAAAAYLATPGEDIGPTAEHAHETDDEPERGGPIGDLHRAGHGFLIRQAPRWVPASPCVVCGKRITHPAASWICEIAGEVTGRPRFPVGGRGDTFTNCGCNACLWNLDERKSGPPPEVCSPSCKRERNRLRMAAQREAERRAEEQAARAWLAADPSWSDRDLAAELGIRRKSVKAARALL